MEDIQLKKEDFLEILLASERVKATEANFRLANVSRMMLMQKIAIEYNLDLSKFNYGVDEQSQCLKPTPISNNGQ